MQNLVHSWYDGTGLSTAMHPFCIAFVYSYGVLSVRPFSHGCHSRLERESRGVGAHPEEHGYHNTKSGNQADNYCSFAGNSKDRGEQIYDIPMCIM